MAIPPHRLDDLRALARAMGRPEPTRTPPLRSTSRLRVVAACIVGAGLGMAASALGPAKRETPMVVATAPSDDVETAPPTAVGALLAAARKDPADRAAPAERTAGAEAPPRSVAPAPAERMPPIVRPSEQSTALRADDQRNEDAELTDTIARSRQRRAERFARAPEAVADRPPAAVADRPPAAVVHRSPAASADRPAAVGDGPATASDATDTREAPMANAARPQDDASDVPDVSGSWDLTNAIATTAHPGFAGLRISFRLELAQDGERIVGRGSKWAVDGVLVPPRQRTPIALAGRIRDGEVVMRFVERGTRRITTGAVRWRLSPDGARMHGEFASSAATTRGTSVAERAS